MERACLFPFLQRGGVSGAADQRFSRTLRSVRWSEKGRRFWLDVIIVHGM